MLHDINIYEIFIQTLNNGYHQFSDGGNWGFGRWNNVLKIIYVADMELKPTTIWLKPTSLNNFSYVFQTAQLSI